MSRSTLSFTEVQFHCFDISPRTIWKFAAFRRGYYPIQAITARHSLSPDSFILCAFTVPCGPTSLQWREHKGLTMCRSSDTQSGRIPSLFRREFWHHAAGELNTATDPLAFWLRCISLFHRSIDDGTYDDSLALILLIFPLPFSPIETMGCRLSRPACADFITYCRRGQSQRLLCVGTESGASRG